MNKDVTIVVSSCDEDIDTLDPFFILLEKYWENRPKDWSVVINTETIEYTREGYNILRYSRKRFNNFSWSKRLRKCLDNVDTPLILFFLSDYFIVDYVDSDKIDLIVKKMLNDSSIGCISLFPNDTCDKYENEMNKSTFRRCVNGSSMVINAQIAFWRTDALKQFLKVNWSAWEFEEYGSEYSYWSNYSFYVIDKNERLVFPYDWTANGYSICARKWTLKCKELFEKNGIDVDFSRRGFFNPAESHYMIRKKNKIAHLFRAPFFRRVMLRLFNVRWKL